MDSVTTGATLAEAPCPVLLHILCLLVILPAFLWLLYTEPEKKQKGRIGIKREGSWLWRLC